MRLFEISLLSLIVGLAAATTTTATRAQDPKVKSEGTLVGTWRLVSKKDKAGGEIELPQRVRIIKLVTSTHWTAVTYNEDGEVSRAFGGSYTLKDDTFEEVPEFGMSSTYDLGRLKGKSQSFRCKIDGNKWSHSGKLSNGGTIDEVWERVEKNP